MFSSNRAGWRAGFVAALAALACSVGAGAAGAESTPAHERAEYVERLESICKPRAQATQRVMRGVRQDVRQERIATAARKFARGTRLFDQTVTLMKPVPRPAADVETLKRWFTYLGQQETYLQGITLDLKAERTIKAQRLTARFIHTGNLANDVVLAYGFNYCSFKFSRFG